MKFRSINIVLEDIPRISLSYIEIDGQRGKDVGLQHYLGVWQHSTFPILSHAQVAAFIPWWGSQISVEPHQSYTYIKTVCLYVCILYAHEFLSCFMQLENLLNLQCNTQNSSLHTGVLFVHELRPFIRDSSTRDAKWFIHIRRPLYPSFSVIYFPCSL